MKIREIKSREVQEKIINVARDLVMAQGYQKTTIRQITEAAGVSHSSLYHFFRDKEDIFLSIMYDIYVKSLHQISMIVSNDDDGIFLYALARVVELKAVAKYRNLAQTFLDVYSSWRISEKVTKREIERCKLFFKPYTKNFSEDDFYVRNLALRGMRSSFVAECIHMGGENFEKRWPFLIETDLQLFNTPKAEIQKTIEKIAKVINEKSFTVIGITI
ncbi:MAG: TetR/AcrR family transcriptional regulator [Porphyromonadaceae bacterium]|nr:TetR/AcrR family transcriptional regulator [Porphyromonadaceae bacterium]